MKLIVMRSVKTSSIKSALRTDFSSPVCLEGQEHIKQVAQFLKGINLQPSKIITSSLKRANDTGESMVAYFDNEIPVVKSTHILPGCCSSDLLKTVKTHNEDDPKDVILVILHEPDIRMILGELMFPESGFQLRILNGDVCVLDVNYDDIMVTTNLCSYFSPCLI